MSNLHVTVRFSRRMILHCVSFVVKWDLRYVYTPTVGVHNVIMFIMNCCTEMEIFQEQFKSWVQKVV